MKEIYTAFVAAQKAFAPAIKNASNPHYKSKYADLAACVEAVLDALNENGIGLVQKTLPDDGGVTVETVFVHSSGESMSAGILHVPATKQDPAGYGSALTYARRYSLMAACGIAPEDDDGNAAKTFAKRPGGPIVTPKQGIGDTLTDDWKVYLRDLADEITSLVRSDRVKPAQDRIKSEKMDDEQYVFMDRHLDSDVRSALKKKEETK